MLGTKHGVERPPVVSTVGEVLKRHGMGKARRKKGGIFKVERGTLTVPERCNHMMGVDYKGWFRLDNGLRCDPLTMSDLHSRYLMKTEVMSDMTVKWTQRFNRWKKEFNEDRPHEALGMSTPAEVCQPSARRLDERIKPRLHDADVKTRRVNGAGFISLNGNTCYVDESLMGVDSAVEESAETALLAIQYSNVKLGWLEPTPNARLRPPAYAERWESKLAPKTYEK